MLNRLYDHAARLSWRSLAATMASSGNSRTASATPKGTVDNAQPSVAPLAHSSTYPTPPLAPSHFGRANHWLIIGILTMTLLIQLAVADRAHLSQIDRYRPTVALLCRLLQCTLPLWHEPTAFTMLHRQISAVPSRPGILQIQISFRNDARWPQAWPDVALRLSDAEGRLIGARRFQPTHYLGRSVTAYPSLLPGQSAHSTFYIREPAANTAAFTFEFY